jgi:hypothetical protein
MRDTRDSGTEGTNSQECILWDVFSTGFLDLRVNKLDKEFHHVVDNVKPFFFSHRSFLRKVKVYIAGVTKLKPDRLGIGMV